MTPELRRFSLEPLLSLAEPSRLYLLVRLSLIRLLLFPLPFLDFLRLERMPDSLAERFTAP